MPRLVRFIPIALIVAALATSASTQAPPLTALAGHPSGALTERGDAAELRIVFSEPMVAVGDMDAMTAPAWLTIAPAIDAAYYWSGTRTLIVTPRPDAPLPRSTRFVVRVNAGVTSVSGRRLAEPFEYDFTTPTPRLESVDWYRRDGRYDAPVLLALRFSQPVRSTDVLSLARVAHEPHDFETPVMSSAARARLAERDPAGLRAFDEKVASARLAASSRADVPVRLTTAWDETRFPPAPELVVLETVGVPPTESWLAISIARGLTGLEGPAGHPEVTSTVRLETTFFVERSSWCRPSCQPGTSNVATLRGGATLAELHEHVHATDGESPMVPKPETIPGVGDTRLRYGLDLTELGLPALPPMVSWVVEADASLEAADGQVLGYPWTETISTPHAQSALYFPGSVWEASNGSSIPLPMLNVARVAERVTPLPIERILPTLQSWGDVTRAQAQQGSMRFTPIETVPDTLQAHRLDLASLLSPSGHGIVLAHARAADLLPGTWFRRGQTNPDTTSVVQVTDLAVTVKAGADATLAFVTELGTGAPVRGANISFVDASNAVRWQGVTDGDGVAEAPASSSRDPFLVVASRGEDAAFASWRDNLQRGRAELPADDGSLGLRGGVFTDRGVYRQGEQVSFKAVMRRHLTDGLQPIAAGDALDVTITDSRNEVVHERTLRAGDWSSVDDTWTVPADAPLGDYTIRVSRPVTRSAREVQDTVAGRFLVAAFRTPDFRVDATLSADGAPVLGGMLRAEVEGRYLFGSPVASRPVRAWFTRGPVVAVPAAIRERYPAEQFAFGYHAASSEGPVLPAPASATLDADGRVTVELPTEPVSDGAWRFTFNAEVESVSAQAIADAASIDIHPADLYPGIERPRGFVRAAEGIDVRVHAAALDGSSRPGRPVEVTLLREEWVPRDGAPIVSWQRVRREVETGAWQVLTTAGGAPLHVPVPSGGRYILRAVATDDTGRRARSEWSFYALGAGARWWHRDPNRIDLVPERDTWSPGETARILVQSPWESARALVTVEREGVRRREMITIADEASTVTVPIVDDDAPNVFVSVVLMKGRTDAEPEPDDFDPGRPGVRFGQVSIRVDAASRRLDVSLEADRETYGPRDEARIDVVVRDDDGEPVPGEVSLWAVDHGVLSLTDYRTPDLVDAIYQNWPSYVSTFDSRIAVIGRLPGDRGDGATRETWEMNLSGGVAGGIAGRGGGGGGGGLAFAARATAVAPPPPAAPQPPGPGNEQTIDARVDFRPLVFWLGSVTTGADGRASTTATLPDSLTTYRIMAVAADRESRFGTAEHEIRATKPLAMLPAFPRFLAQGDNGSFGVTVTSAEAGAGEATVTIHSLDPGVLSFAETSRVVTLTAGETVSVRFDGRAIGRGTGRVQVSVSLGGETDALDWAIPVVQPLRTVVSAAYGDTLDRATERLALPPGIVSGSGLTVELASTALVGLGEGARYLRDYPYECAEQKASRALAQLLDAQLSGAFGLSAGDPDALRDEALHAVDELFAFQCQSSGGFSLWPGQCQAVSPYLTAYILHVLHVAGYPDSRDYRVDRALRFLESSLRTPPPEAHWRPAWAASQAYAVKVLAEHGRQQPQAVGLLYGELDRMPVFARSYLADAIMRSGRGPRYADVIRRIANSTRVEADRAFVQELDSPSLLWLWHSNVRATAAVLEGFVRRGDDPSLAASMARWLLAAREDGRWRTTHENAAALEALVRFFRLMEAVEPDMTATVGVEGASIGTQAFLGRSDEKRTLRVALGDLSGRLGTDRTGNLVVDKTGDGRLYYTARLAYDTLVPAESEARGIHITRQYERYVPGGEGEVSSSFELGDIVRVRLTLDLSREGRYLALTDRLPAGFEPVDATFATTASDLAQEATRQSAGDDWRRWWRDGGFDHSEKHDDRVLAFATRLAPGRHEFSYLAQATTAGEFTATGASAEAMYAPEVTGRSATSRVIVR